MNSTDRPGDSSSSRGGDRRQNDRRRNDRRAPLPLWRRPWAYIAYGVTGAMLLVLVLSLENDAGEVETPVAEVATRRAGPAVDSTAVAAAGPVQDAYGPAGYSRLLAEGEGATGRRVRTVVYCEPIRSVALRTGDDVAAHPSVVATADASARVPAAECRWGETSTAPELLLVVPAESAEEFANAREVTQGFVQRREVRAEVEWIGQSQALALRTVAVLRSLD